MVVVVVVVMVGGGGGDGGHHCGGSGTLRVLSLPDFQFSLHVS